LLRALDQEPNHFFVQGKYRLIQYIVAANICEAQTLRMHMSRVLGGERLQALWVFVLQPLSEELHQKALVVRLWLAHARDQALHAQE
jgi:hypothetical protein